MRLITSPTTPCAMTLGSVGFRLPRFLPFGHPPSFAFLRAARALAGVLTLPSNAPMLSSPPQCGHLISDMRRNRNLTVRYYA